MPSLGNYNPKEYKKVTSQDINEARRLAETIVAVDGHQVQFDNISRQRMMDVISHLQVGETVEWYFYDGSSALLTKGELYDIYAKAANKIGEQTLHVFSRARLLKEKLADGEHVSQADIELQQWGIN